MIGSFIGLAVGGHQAFGGMGGGIGGIVIAQTAGHTLQVTGSCHALFVMAASAHLIALVAIQPLTPRLAPVVVRAPVRSAP